MPTAPVSPTPPATATLPSPRWWLWPQMLSLEAPAIAVLWMAALAHTHRLRLPPPFYWGLFLATWVVYLLDRLGDAEAAGEGAALTERHAFHWRHRRLLRWGLVPVILCALLWAALWDIPESLALQGLGLVLLGALYLASYSTAAKSRQRMVLLGVGVGAGLLLLARLPVPSIYRLSAALAFSSAAFLAARQGNDKRWRIVLPKELLASLLFVLGASAGVHFWSDGEHGWLCLETLLLWAIAALNMAGIACAESLHGGPNAHGSIAQTHPQIAGTLPILAMGLAAISGTVLVQSLAGRDTPYMAGTAAMVLASSCLLLLLQLSVQRLSPATFRTLADFALLLPLPLVWWVGK